VENLVRHVFVFIDGTLARSETNTNIWKLYQLVGGSENRDARYQEGIASLSTAKYLQTVFPTEINAEAYQQYKLLDALGIRPEDRLYIIGFSRGAIVARILAQMITSDVARASIIGQSDQVTNVRRNTVDFLGLFDPVRGYPYPFKIKGYGADACKNPSILNVSEMISLDDAFPFFRPDASIAARTFDRERSGIIERIARQRESSKEKCEINCTSTRKISRHYCVLPGVHRDIGGQEANVALSRISMFQMLQDLFSAFPDVEGKFDRKGIDGFRRELDMHDNIRVGEGSSMMRKVLRWRRKFRPDPHATVHPLIKELDGQMHVSHHVLGRKWRRYRIPKFCSDWPLTNT
jgi:T6SS, Phospholipase effector Tle1-like, catalytic domain